MHAKKLLPLLLSALAAVTLLASCGSRWDYSREAVKAANEAQGEILRVEFQVDQKFTNALHDAVEENIQPADVEKAMLADASLKELLTSGYRLNVYALRADVDAEEAARTIAEEQILPRLSGCKDEGVISMVKADNNYFYEAVLTYKEGGSGGGGGGGSSEPGQPDPQPTMYKITVVDYDTSLGTVTAPEEVEKGGSFTFTVEPSENADVTSVSVSGDYENCEDAEETYTVSNVQSDITITVVFEEKEEEYPVQWYETNDGEYEAGTLIFREGASAVMRNKTMTLEATITGLKAGQYAANPTAAENFSFQNVVHLIVKEGSGVTEIPGYTEEEVESIDLTAPPKKGFLASQKLKDVSLSGVEKIGMVAFYMTAVEKVALTNAEDIDIAQGAFMYCTWLFDVTIDAKNDLKIGNNAFDGALGVGASYGRDCTTKLTGGSIWIGEKAFRGIRDEIRINGNVESVGNRAFANNIGSPEVELNSDVTIHYAGGAEKFAEVCDGGLAGVGLTEENFAA